MTSRRLGEVLRGLGATALLALLLVGVPVLLVMAVGQPWPQGIPTWDGIRRAFDTGVIPDGFFVKFVACVMWVAWLQLVVSFVVEVRAVVQDRSPERVPLVPGGMQVLVGRLVAATALVLSSFQVGAPTAAALVAGDGAGYQSAALVFDGPVGGAASTVDSARIELLTAPAPSTIDAAAPTEEVVHTVQRRDTLRGLARQYLGDADSWPVIFELNRGAPQGDGGSLSDPAVLRAGWALRIPVTGPGQPDEPAVAAPASSPLPAPVSVAPAPAAANGAAAAQVTEIVVEKGDNFWVLAEQTLAEATGREPTEAEVHEYWERLIEANRANLLPPEDPDLIYPGQVLQLVPVATPVAPPPPPAPDVAQLDRLADAVVVDATGAGGPAGTAPAPAPVTETVSLRHLDEPAPVAQAAAPADAGEDGEESAPTLLFAATGGLVAAGMVGALATLRRAQQRHRGRGRRIRLPAPWFAGGESVLRAAGQGDLAERVSAVLNAAATAGAPARVSWVACGPEGQITMALLEPVPAPVPFTSASGGRVWALAAAVPIEALPAGGDSATPLLVSVGRTALSGLEVLVNLEERPVLRVSGERAVDVLRSIATALATAPWSRQVRVVLCGVEGELHRLPWVDTVASPGEALTLLEANRAEAMKAAVGVAIEAPAAARFGHDLPESWSPLAAVLDAELSASDRARLEGIGSVPGACAAVVHGDGTRGVDLVVAADGTARFADLPEPVVLHRITVDDAEVIDELLRTATDLDDVAADDLVAPDHAGRVPSAGGTGSPAPLPAAVAPPSTDRVPALPGPPAAGDVCVAVMGPVEVQVTGAEEPLRFRRAKSLEAIALLALSDGPLHPEDVQALLWPSGAVTRGALHNAVYEARDVLGAHQDGSPYLARATDGDGRYRLHPAVTTDHARFVALRHAAARVDDPAARASVLREALGLVRGPALTGRGRGFDWATRFGTAIESEVVDAALDAAEAYLELDDPKSSSWSARQGLLASPYDERLYVALMAAAHASGSVAAVNTIYAELQTVVADDVEPVDSIHPDTVAAYERYSRPGSATPEPAETRVVTAS